MKRIGLLGCGAIGRVHARNLAPHAELVFCSRRRARAEEFRQQFGGVGVCQRYEDLLAMEEVAGVVIATPPDVHTAQVVQALEAGKAVMVEKPMCASRAEVDEIGAALSARPEAVLMVAENYYYKPSLALMKEVIEWDGIGAVQRMVVKKLTQQSAEGWKSAYGALLEGGIHFIALMADLADTALAAAAPRGGADGVGESTTGVPVDTAEAQHEGAGAPAQRVSAEGRGTAEESPLKLDPGGGDAASHSGGAIPELQAPSEIAAEFPTLKRGGGREERHAKVQLRWNGLAGSLHYAWDRRSLLKGVFQHSVIEGDRGRILFESNGIYVHIKGEGRRGLTFPGVRDLMGYGEMTRDFMKCLEEKGRKPYSDFERAKRDLSVVFQAYEELPY
ncbi:MAG: Gfo/Idh/MocA family oxidoreductase [Candidatus Latescibacterota bacterium]|nr:Gfo/Idh/MocA family oxidoreductase [Candidatus Latescibacterota bacterium]